MSNIQALPSISAVAGSNRYPYCVVWSPIPFITWLLPFVGHVGVCLSNGVILDFAAPFLVSVDNMAFGNPTRFWKLDPERAVLLQDFVQLDAPSRDKAIAWDAAVQSSSRAYQAKNYNFLTENCHCFVSHFLNSIAYGGRNKWNSVRLAVVLMVHGQFISSWGAIKTLVPPVVVLPLGWYMGRMLFVYAWLGFFVLFVTWFSVYTFYLRKPEPTWPRPRYASI